MLIVTLRMVTTISDGIKKSHNIHVVRQRNNSVIYDDILRNLLTDNDEFYIKYKPGYLIIAKLSNCCTQNRTV